jgi:protease PrsW
LIRLTVLPALHAFFTGISCFFLGLASWHRRHRLQMILTGLAIAVVLHGFYDGLHASWIVAALAVTLFIAYVATGNSIDSELRGAPVSEGPLIILRPRHETASACEPISLRLRRLEE